MPLFQPTRKVFLFLLTDSASKLVSLGQIKFSSLTASAQLAFALHHTASSNTSVTLTDEPISSVTVSNNVPSHIPIATMAFSHLRSRRSLSSVAGSVASTIIQPLQVCGICDNISIFTTRLLLLKFLWCSDFRIVRLAFIMMQIVAPASSVCYLSLFITPALFSLAELTMIVCCLL